MRWAPLLAILVGAGCVGTPAEELDRDAAPGAMDGEAPPAQAPANASVTTLTPTSATVVNATSFAWRSNATFGDLALSMRIAAAEETTCDIGTAMARDGGGPGFDFARFIVRDGTLGSWAGGGAASFASAHAGDATTEELVLAGGGGASGVGSSTKVGPDGIEIVLAGRSVAPMETGITDNGSVLVNVTCGAPIGVSDFAYSHEIAIYTAGSGSAGVGATAFVAAASAQELVGLEAASPRVVAAMFATGPAQVRVTSPEGATSAMAHPFEPARLLVEGERGAWSIGADAAAGLFPARGVIVGLQPVASWDDIAPK